MATNLPDGFPLTPTDADGCLLRVGDRVRILSVESCAKGLPAQGQERLRALVGQDREIVEFDDFGFVWLCFGPDNGADFCLFPVELSLVDSDA